MKLRRSGRRLNDPPQPRTNDSESTDSKSQPRQDRLRIIVVIENSHASISYESANNQASHPAQFGCWGRLRRWCWPPTNEGLTAKGTFILGIFAVLGFVLTLKSLRETRTEFRDTERPWVGLVNTEVDGYPTDTNISVTLTLQNTGRSPAQQMWLRAFALTPLDSANYAQTGKWCEGKPTDAGVGSLVLPGQRRELQIFSDRLQPGTIEYIREQLAEKPKPQTPVNLHPEGIILSGCIDYMWHNRCYRTRFCQQYMAVSKPARPFGDFGYCNFNNDDDENAECKRE
jgi:hypothetical protein